MNLFEHFLILSPFLLVAGKIGLTFSLWSLACAAVRALNAATDYLNRRE